MDTRYRVMVAGLGKRGVHHAAAFCGNPRFTVVGVSDVDAEKLKDVGKFGDPMTGTDPAALARALKPDVFCSALRRPSDTSSRRWVWNPARS